MGFNVTFCMDMLLIGHFPGRKSTTEVGVLQSNSREVGHIICAIADFKSGMEYEA